MTLKLDILAFGVHPDDVELGCAGTILASVAQGKKVGIVDLTKGELGTRGSGEIRLEEANSAAKVLKVSVRENLGMADGFFCNDEAQQRRVIEVIRKFQPDIVLCNALDDRHPDHGRSGHLVQTAAFLSGLRKIETTSQGDVQKAWRPANVFHYIQDRFFQPDFVFDISDYHEQKLEAIRCYKTQFFNPELNEPETYISTQDFFETVKARALLLGKRIGVKYAEGFASRKLLGIQGFDAFVHQTT